MGDINDIVFKITQQVQETEENFIFQTLKSYSENIVESEVSKKDLSRAIINYFNPTTPQVKAGYLHNRWKCIECGTLLDYDYNRLQGLDYIYCYKCGRRMKRR